MATCYTVSATGSELPPMIVFLRRNFKNHISARALPDVMRHFVHMTSSTKDNATLLIMDNDKSHLAPGVLNIVKEMEWSFSQYLHTQVTSYKDLMFLYLAHATIFTMQRQIRG
nr:unnamed protein product [Callosobruchus analis]